MDQAPVTSVPALTPCGHCGTPFQPRKRWQRFCQNACRRAFHKATGGGDLAKRVAELERRVGQVETVAHPAFDFTELVRRIEALEAMVWPTGK